MNNATNGYEVRRGHAVYCTDAECSERGSLHPPFVQPQAGTLLILHCNGKRTWSQPVNAPIVNPFDSQEA